MHPQTRSVFDRYGLKGCGGAEGPAESVGFFARAHGVELDVLLMELEQAIENPESLPSDENVDPADSIYRRFFKAGIITTLTAGAVWGALLLIKIGFKSSFTAISIFDVNAHGHAQIFGWVGLFVMGFAYQAFPRFRHTTLWNPPLAVFSFYLMIIGLIVRVFSEPLHQATPFFWLGVLGGVLELTAILLFVFIILRTVQQSQKPLVAYDYYIGAALFWFVSSSSTGSVSSLPNHHRAQSGSFVEPGGYVASAFARYSNPWVCHDHDFRRQPKIFSGDVRIPGNIQTSFAR